jgi:hypothetical protein
MKKWTEGVVAEIYSAVLPTDIKKILFLIITSVMFQKSVGKFWISHQNF